MFAAGGNLYSARDATLGLAVAKNAPYKTAKDLIGATIAVSTLADFNQLGISAWLDHNGVSPSQVHFVELRFSRKWAKRSRAARCKPPKSPSRA